MSDFFIFGFIDWFNIDEMVKVLVNVERVFIICIEGEIMGLEVQCVVWVGLECWLVELWDRV